MYMICMLTIVIILINFVVFLDMPSITHGPYAFINLFAETYWDNCSLGWSLVQFEFLSINWCVLLCTIGLCSLSLSWFSYLCSMFPKSTHATFSTKLFQNFRAHPRLEKAKFSETDFTISHYAGKACYMQTIVGYTIICWYWELLLWFVLLYL